jgi:DNA-binding transcriptional regulator YiaG
MTVEQRLQDLEQRVAALEATRQQRKPRKPAAMSPEEFAGLRAAACMSMADLADRLRLSAQAVWAMEHGITAISARRAASVRRIVDAAKKRNEAGR